MKILVDSIVASQMSEQEKKDVIEVTGKVVEDVKTSGRLRGMAKMLWTGLRESIKIVPAAVSAWDALMKHWG